MVRSVLVSGVLLGALPARVSPNGWHSDYLLGTEYSIVIWSPKRVGFSASMMIYIGSYPVTTGLIIGAGRICDHLGKFRGRIIGAYWGKGIVV